MSLEQRHEAPMLAGALLARLTQEGRHERAAELVRVFSRAIKIPEPKPCNRGAAFALGEAHEVGVLAEALLRRLVADGRPEDGQRLAVAFVLIGIEVDDSGSEVWSSANVAP